MRALLAALASDAGSRSARRPDLRHERSKHTDEAEEERMIERHRREVARSRPEGRSHRLSLGVDR